MSLDDVRKKREERRIDLGIAMAESALDKILKEVEDLVSSNPVDKEVTAEDGYFSTRVTSDRLTAFVDIHPPIKGGRPVESIEILRSLRDDGVEHVLEENVISAVSTCKKEGESIYRVVAAQGIPSKPSQDGSVRFLFPVGSEFDFSKDESGRVDYKDRGKILSVLPGEELAYLEPPVEGEPGRDVYGKPVSVPKPKKVSLIAGKGVETDDGRIFRASVQGQPILMGNELSVREVYVISGDVDMSTGNVDFSGTVVVNGTVREGFSVRCDGDVEIKGAVESGTVVAAGNGHLSAVIGDKSYVEIGGDLSVRFIQGGEVVAGKDIEVGAYVLHSRVMSGGDIKVEGKKGVIGGHLTALKRIDLSSAGAIMGTVTILEAGTSYYLKRELSELEERISHAQEAMDRIYALLQSTLPAYRAGKEIPRELAERLRLIQRKKDELASVLRLWKDRQMSIRRQIADAGDIVPIVSIRNKAYPGVEVRIRGEVKHIEREVRYLSLSRDPDSGRIVVGPYK